jgi:hypothetical protein
MRLYLTAIAAAAVSSFLLSANAGASPVGAAAAIQQSLAETSMVEQVRRVCRRDRAGRRVCWTDRSGPITVCHWVRDRRGNIVRDCY